MREDVLCPAFHFPGGGLFSAEAIFSSGDYLNLAGSNDVDGGIN